MKYYIETYGCQMNVYDSGKLEELLKGQRFLETRDPAEADFILVNTCSVRQHAEERALARIGELGRVREKSNAVLAVCGCMAQRLGPELLRRRGVDIVIGPDAYSGLLPAFEKTRGVGSKTVDTTRDARFRFDVSNGGRIRGLRAFVSIMKGCSNSCSFCIVPSVRGPAVSRPHVEVLREVETLVNGGAKDITLIGQNVNAYGDGSVDFARLLAMASEGAGESRIRFATSHPKDMSGPVIEVMAGGRGICEHLHLPLQSGSNRVLERMRRGYTVERYLDIVKAVRGAVPGVSVTTDIIVGFPGETVEDFAETCRVVEDVGFDSAFMFKFSPRAGTGAASMKDDVPVREKERRLSALICAAQSVSSRKSAALVGRVMEVLVEGEKTKGGEKFLLGRTRCNRTVHVNGSSEAVGKYVHVKIDSSNGISVHGTLVDH